MSALLILYAIVGPGGWLVLALGMYLAYVRMCRLSRRRRVALPEPLPGVTVLIPAKDEGEGVRDAIGRVLAMDYANFRVIAIDDRSADQTGAIFDELAAKNPDRLHAIHIPHDGLPPGWLGKCNALHTAAKEVTTPWILFVDSDVKVERDALSVALEQAAGRGYDAVSILTRLECEGFLAQLVLPLAAASVGAMTRMSQTNEDTRKHIAFANGQFILIRREAYEKVGGHEAVRDNITEDVALMRLLKRAGSRVRLYYGQQFASTQMHTSFMQMRNGWARIFSGACERNPWPIVAAMLFVLLAGLSVYVALIGAFVARDMHWLGVALVHWIIMSTVLTIVYAQSGNRRRLSLLFPLGGTMMLALYAAAIKACFTGRIAWRGTSYTAGSASPQVEWLRVEPPAGAPAEEPARSHP
jgi:cellulose synthase/poly-beta-1,6-N-acetylglucosamine synthase-like glycosyltransferase